MTTTTTTHEQFIHRVRTLVVSDALRREAITPDEADKLTHTKLVYGVGTGARGTCHYGAWTNGVGPVEVVEIAAAAEESWVQLAGTTIHELAHVLAGTEAGHGSDWKDTTKRLGFTKRPEAAGQTYHLALFQPRVRLATHEIADEIADGTPNFVWLAFAALPRPCSAGVGVRGGKSRGKGSGSRLRLYECQCAKPVKVRVASDTFAAHCDECGEAFERRS